MLQKIHRFLKQDTCHRRKLGLSFMRNPHRFQQFHHPLRTGTIGATHFNYLTVPKYHRQLSDLTPF